MDELQYQKDLLMALNKRLSINERMLNMICGTTTNAFLYCNFHNSSINVLGCFRKIFDVDVNYINDIYLMINFMEPSIREVASEKLSIERMGIESSNFECCLLDQITWLDFEVNVKYDHAGKPIDKMIRIRDISKYKLQNEELTIMAYYDSLTGLYNRNYFVQTLSEWVRKASDEQALISVMCLDIDNFNRVNDGLGMVYGDELILLISNFFKELKNDNMIIARINNDQFYFAIYDPSYNCNVEVIYESIQRRLSESFILSERQEINISASVGVAEYPEAGKNSLELLNASEIVMFKAKSLGKNGISYYEPPIMKDFIDTVNIEKKLKDAIAGNKFELYFQPQFDSDSKSLRGVEALIRLKDEDGTMVSPSIFIPIAERCGMIIPIGNWVLEEGISKFAKWKKNYEHPLILSLNISAIQYRKADFVGQLLKIIEDYDVSPSDIELEITESVLIEDFNTVVNKLHILKNCGVKLSLDDFGTGYSSLSYLKGLPIDTLKIDKSFIDTVIQDKSTKVITESIVSMVRKLGYETVAEGVETKEQYDYLREINCDNIQGFYLGRPMPASDFEELLKSKR